jgi:hypothetical protein
MGWYHSRTRIAGLLNSLLKRLVVLNSFAVVGIFPAIRLKQTEWL